MTTASIRLVLDAPALILAPMQGLTDAPMRALQGETGAFTFAVSEFLRVSADVPSPKVFRRHVPELLDCGRTGSGLPVQVQLLGGDAGRLAASAHAACEAGARAIDLNFGCPARTVNRHDGGATLLKHPQRIHEIVAAVRAAVPPDIPVSAKLRLGWDSPDAIFENAEMAASGGADWLTIHGRTRMQGYEPPAYWEPIGKVRERLGIPVVANGDIWTLEDFRRSRDQTGCQHFMLGRGALADPALSHQIARELGLPASPEPGNWREETNADWIPRLQRLVTLTEQLDPKATRTSVLRLKQWLKIASLHGRFSAFEAIKRAQSREELFAVLSGALGYHGNQK